VAHDGSDEVIATFPEAVGQIADASTSSSRKNQNVYGAMKRGNGREGETSADSDNQGVVEFKMKPGARRNDSGSAARFFYCSKASKGDRGEGNDHPTVKPTVLMQWLCRLVTPQGGLVLDPFMGSGSTGKAALLEGFSFLGIEREEAYVEIARRRLA
jgi:site-specific DNA-methyltransferase (adenine-specific)